MSLIKVSIPVKGADAGNFKVGDLVRMNEGGLTGKITKIEPNGHFRVSFLYNRANGFSQSFSANEIVMVKPAKDSSAGAGAQDADIREPKVGDVLKYYHPRTGKYVGKVKVVNIHRHSGAKWDAQFECEYLDGELKGGRFRDEGGENISFDSAAQDAITESDLKKHAHDFARYELGKYADELRKKRNSLADLWEKTSIAGGAIRSGEYKQADIDEFVNPYVNAIDDAIRILERI